MSVFYVTLLYNNFVILLTISELSLIIFDAIAIYGILSYAVIYLTALVYFLSGKKNMCTVFLYITFFI